MFKNFAGVFLASYVAGQSADDVWDQYTVGDMESFSVTGGKTYDQVVVMLHGGGGSGYEWVYDYK